MNGFDWRAISFFFAGVATGFPLLVLWETWGRYHYLELRAVVQIAIVRQRQRKIIAEETKRVEALKGVIRAIGAIEIDPGGMLHLLEGWEIDCSNGTPVHRADAKGVFYYCGYTRAELLEIHKRRDEYVERRPGR